MKKTHILGIALCFVAIAVRSASPLNYLSKGYADTLYCPVSGGCGGASGGGGNCSETGVCPTIAYMDYQNVGNLFVGNTNISSLSNKLLITNLTSLPNCASDLTAIAQYTASETCATLSSVLVQDTSCSVFPPPGNCWNGYSTAVLHIPTGISSSDKTESLNSGVNSFSFQPISCVNDLLDYKISVVFDNTCKIAITNLRFLNQSSTITQGTKSQYAWIASENIASHAYLLKNTQSSRESDITVYDDTGIVSFPNGIKLNKLNISLTYISMPYYWTTFGYTTQSQKTSNTFNILSSDYLTIGAGDDGSSDSSINFTIVGTNQVKVMNQGGISLYVAQNVSAQDYITRTSIFDKSKNVWDYIHDADYYINDGQINHTKFYGGNNHSISLNAEIDLLRQAVYELKTEMCKSSISSKLCG